MVASTVLRNYLRVLKRFPKIKQAFLFDKRELEPAKLHKAADGEEVEEEGSRRRRNFESVVRKGGIKLPSKL